MKKIFANFIITMNKSEILENMNIIFNEYNILDFQKNNGFINQKSKNIIILPAFINAHSHLELSFLSGNHFLYKKKFTNWLKNIVKVKASTSLNEKKKKLK